MAKNVYVKIPILNTKGKFTGKTIKRLSNEKVKLNITAVYTFEQVKKIVKQLNKNQKQLFLFLQVEWEINLKILFQFLKNQ